MTLACGHPHDCPVDHSVAAVTRHRKALPDTVTCCERAAHGIIERRHERLNKCEVREVLVWCPVCKRDVSVS